MFEACRVPHLVSLPFSAVSEEPCPRIAWSLAEVRLHSDAGAIDEVAREVNMLAHADGHGLLRFVIESPELAREAAPAPARSVLLDVQLEASPTQLRGRLSALAAPLSSQPGDTLRYAALWKATFETARFTAAPSGLPAP